MFSLSADITSLLYTSSEMNNKILLGTALLSAGAIAWAAKDPVVMRVAGVDVPRSEFEYLYNKNSRQQVEAQPLDEYVELFKKYKLKVADAKSMGLDTLASFKKEMTQFRSELAAPYLADSAYLDQLARDAYERMKIEIPTSHIMIFKTASRSNNAAGKHLLDSLRGEIIKGADFAQLAEKYSQDRGSSSQGGSLGYVTANKFPFSFENAVYALKPGEVSEIVESPVGYHLVKVGESRPASGEVLAEHILLLTQGLPDQEAETLKTKADSIYNVAAADPAMFEDLARRFSQDPGSASQGGALPWFGVGRMVPEFETVAFALKPGEVSRPVKSRFGWHIIKKLDSRGLAPFEEMRAQLIKRVQHPQDERSRMIRDRQTLTLSKRLNGRYTKELRKLRENIMANGIDSTFYAMYESTPAAAAMPIIAIGKKTVPLSEFVPRLRHVTQDNGPEADRIFSEELDAFFNLCLVDAEIDRLEAEVPEYRNLLHEYRDGSLLYEASVRNVWDRASKDQKGLEEFFNANRADYAWKEPRAKGILVQAKTDSVAKAIQARYLQLGKDSAINTLRNEFKGEIKIDRVLVSQGSNHMVDNILFGGPAAQPTAAGFQTYFMLEPRVIMAPEEVADVRPQLVSDYQNELERLWIEQLQAKYPVEIFEKELRKVKPTGSR